MIDVEHLVKDYGTVVAVNDVSFSVGRGEIVGFLGPNGAGKSTTLRILSGFLGPTSGRVRINGHDILEDGLSARRALGYMPESSPLYPEMRVSEYLRFRAELKGVSRRERVAAVGRSMEAAGVSEMSETLIGHLSKGYRQRTGLADALVANPPLLILDEPTAGLDPNQIHEVRKLIRGLGENHTILLSTHILPEVETTCDRAVVINRGKLVAEGTIEELRARRATKGATLLVSDVKHEAKDVVAKIAGVARVLSEEVPDGLVRLEVSYADDEKSGGALLEEIIARLVAAEVGIREASRVRASLEDVFRDLTVSDVAEATPSETEKKSAAG